MAINNPIKGFVKQYRFLSNFYTCRVVDELGVVYSSVENAYQAAKTDDVDLRKHIATLSPTEAKEKGKSIETPDWSKSKILVMKGFIRQKFIDNPDLGNWLLDTGDAYIEETNYWGDTFWGKYNNEGDNYLGKILMEVREDLKRAKFQKVVNKINKDNLVL